MSSIADNHQTSFTGVHKNLDHDFAVWIQEELDKHHILGASIAVVDNGEVENAAYGLARLPDTPCTPDTIFRMASTSKAMGAAIMGLILEDETKNTVIVDGKKEKLTWSTPIIKILGEDFDFQDDGFNKNVTIEDALSNRSGVSGHDYNFGPWMGNETRKYVRSLRHIDAVRAPVRTTFQYNNTMFAVIGLIIEKIEGKSFEEAARDRLWKPLGMTSTFASLESLTAPEHDNGRRLARGYFWAPDTSLNEKSPAILTGSETEFGHYIAEAHVDLDLVGPAAAVLSTPNDYAKWISALLKASKKPSSKDRLDQHDASVISHNLFTDLTTARTLVIPSALPTIGNNLLKYPRISPQLYALGWFTDPWMYPGQTILHHSGDCQGFASHVFLLPEHDFGIVLTENGGGGGSRIAQAVGREIIGRRLVISQEERREGTMTTVAAATEQDVGESDASDTAGEETTELSTGCPPKYFETTIIPGTYEKEGYGRIQISLAPSASLETKNPTIDGVRLIRKFKSLPNTKATDTTTSIYHISFLGRRSFPSSLLLHPSPKQPVSLSEFDSGSHNSTPIFFTLENLWPHGLLQSDPISCLPSGYGTIGSDTTHPFAQEAVYESQTIMRLGACIEVNRDGNGNGGDVRVGLVLGRTESSEFRGRVGRDKERLVGEWRRKMVWFEKVDD